MTTTLSEISAASYIAKRQCGCQLFGRSADV